MYIRNKDKNYCQAGGFCPVIYFEVFLRRRLIGRTINGGGIVGKLANYSASGVYLAPKSKVGLQLRVLQNGSLFHERRQTKVLFREDICIFYKHKVYGKIKAQNR